MEGEGRMGSQLSVFLCLPPHRNLLQQAHEPLGDPAVTSRLQQRPWELATFSEAAFHIYS